MEEDMNRKNLSRSRIRGDRRAGYVASLLTAGALVGIAAPAYADGYQLTDLVTNDNTLLTSLGFPAAAHVDSNLINPWGVSFTPASPYWVSDNGTGVSTLYSASGVQVSAPFPRHDRPAVIGLARLCLDSDRPSPKW
jgi:hypothetical protein